MRVNLRPGTIVERVVCQSAVAGALAVCIGLAASSSGIHAQQPSFRSSAETLAVDVNVLDRTGRPVTGLAAADFDVRVDGRPRRVVNIQWIATDAASDEPGLPIHTVPEGYASNQTSTRQSGHLVVIAIDEVNLPPGALSSMQKAVGDFIDSVAQTSPIAVVGLGVRSSSTGFTIDRERLKNAVALIRGQQDPGGGGALGFFDMGLSVAVRITQGDVGLIQAMVRRDCLVRDGQGYDGCVDQIRMAADLIVQNATQEGLTTESRLRDLLMNLRNVAAPKTLVLVSQGFYINGDVSRIDALASLAGDAQTTIYGLAVDEAAFVRRRATLGGPGVSDRLERIRSLENLSTASRGMFLSLKTNGTDAFKRVARELSGYYLLGVESTPADNDGRSHRIRVDVRRPETTVRARRSFVRGSDAADSGRTPRQIVAAALGAPILAVGLPVRASAVAFRDADRSKMQLLVHAEIGSDYVKAQNIAIGVTVTDRDGKVVGGQVGEANLVPTMAGVPSALPFEAGANVAPGEYTVKVAAADGDRVGSVEWIVRAGLLDLDAATCTELVAGGPVLPVNLFQPTMHSQVVTGTLHGYFEMYGANIEAFTTRFEVASDGQSAPLLTADVDPLSVSEDRVIFSRTVNIESLPPGMYTLRAIIRRSGQTQRTLTREFEVGRPAPPASTPGATPGSTPANATATVAAAAPRFLPVDPARLARPFDRAQLLEPTVLGTFREQVGATTRELFDVGVAQYRKGDYQDAVATFKRAVRPGDDPTAPMTYLAATYALQGQDGEAANIWRTAILTGGELPDIYGWLADALIRRKALGEAQPLLEDAVTRWPADRRFLRLLAMLYGMNGRAPEALDLLGKSITSNPDDVDSMVLALEWLYSVSRDGKAFRTRAEDVQLALTYAEQYLKTGGPDAALVRRWQAYFGEQ